MSVSVVMMFCNADDIAFTIPTDDDNGDEFDDVDDEAERFAAAAAAAAACEMAPTSFSFCFNTATAVAALVLVVLLDCGGNPSPTAAPALLSEPAVAAPISKVVAANFKCAASLLVTALPDVVPPVAAVSVGVTICCCCCCCCKAT